MSVIEVNEPIARKSRGRPRKDGTPAQARNQSGYQPPRPVNRSEAESAMLDIFAAGIEMKLQDRIEAKASNVQAELENYLDMLAEDIKAHKHLTITTERGTGVVKGLQHVQFQSLMRALTTSFPVMLVGPAGSGKTFSSEQAAEAMGLKYYAISVGSQTSKTDLLGYMTAHGDYVRTQFREAYENGGLFLMDEIDAGNPNVLIVLNSALAGTQCAFPDGMVDKHKDFVFVSTANTYGTGANRQYVGRNQLDAATLDRFLTLDWPVDEKLEFEMINGYADGARWHKVVKAVRKLVDERGFRVIISPRASLKGAQLLAAGFDFDTVLKMTLLSNAPEDHASAIESTARSNW